MIVGGYIDILSKKVCHLHSPHGPHVVDASEVKKIKKKQTETKIPTVIFSLFFLEKKWSILLIILQDKESQLFLIGPSNGCRFDCRYPTEDIV